MTWEWLSALGEDENVGGHIRVLEIRAASSVLGLFPIERGVGPGPLRAVGPGGWRWLHPDHLDVLAAPEHRLAAAHAVVRHLGDDKRWDLLDLAGLAGSGALAHVAGALRPSRAVRLPERDLVAPYVDLRGQSEMTLVPSRQLRQQLRRSLRRAEGAGGGFSVVTEPESVARLLKTLMHLHNARFGSASQVFATPARRAFHVRAARRLAAAGMARIYRLAGARDVDAALLYALVVPPRLFYYALGMDPNAAMSPGRTLLGAAILSATREGFEEFDLLRGDHPFKQRFASGARRDRRVLALRPSTRTLRAVPALLALARRHRDEAERSA